MALKKLKTPGGDVAAQETTISGTMYTSDTVGAAMAVTLVGPDGAQIPGGSQSSPNVTIPPSISAAQVLTTRTTLVAATNTTIAVANPNRIAIQIQTDGTAATRIGQEGEALTGTRGGEISIPATADAIYTPPLASTTAITAYSTGTTTLYVTEWSKA